MVGFKTAAWLLFLFGGVAMQPPIQRFFYMPFPLAADMLYFLFKFSYQDQLNKWESVYLSLLNYLSTRYIVEYHPDVHKTF